MHEISAEREYAMTDRLNEDAPVPVAAVLLSIGFLFLCTLFWNLGVYALLAPAAVATCIFIRRPETYLILLLTLTTTVSFPSYTMIPVPMFGSGMSVIELAVGIFVVRSLTAGPVSELRKTPVVKAVLLYLAWLLFSLLWQSVIGGNWSINMTRGYFLISAVIPTVIFMKEKRQWVSLLKGLIILALFSAIIGFLVYFRIGPEIFWQNIIGSFRMDRFVSETAGDSPRVLLGGVQLAYLVLFVSFTSILTRKGGPRYALLLFICSALFILISQTRAFLITSLPGLLFVTGFALFSGQDFLRKERVPLVATGLLAGSALLIMTSGSLVLDRLGFLAGISSAADFLTADSMVGRHLENLIAGQLIMENPVFGGGLGRSLLELERFTASAVPHNAFVSLGFIFGIPGVLFWISTSVVFLIYGWKLLRTRGVLTESEKSWLLGMLVAFTGFSVASFTAQVVTVKAALPVVVMLGYLHYLLSREHETE